MVKFKDKDMGEKKIFGGLRDIHNTSIVVGIIGRSTYSEDGTVAVVDYATFNEFGTRHIPKRSFIRSTFDENAQQFLAAGANIISAQMVAGAVFDTKTSKLTVSQRLNRLGMFMASKVQAQITKGGVPYKPNAASTIARKGSTSPLIDTGRMRQSVTYEVRKK